MTTPRKQRSPAPRRSSRTAAPRRSGSARAAPRTDFGAPLDGFFAKQPPHLRAILEVLRGLVEAAAPDAQGTIKWGMAHYAVNGAMMCALTAHKAHVNLVLSGPSDAFADPDGRLTGESERGRHLRLTSVDEIPRARVKAWLRTAAGLARAG